MPKTKRRAGKFHRHVQTDVGPRVEKLKLAAVFPHFAKDSFKQILIK